MPGYRLAHKLDEDGRKKVAKLPETGMGFRIIRSRIPDHDDDLFVALGLRLLLPAGAPEQLNAAFQEIVDSGVSSFDELLESESIIAVPLLLEPEVVATRLDRELDHKIGEEIDEEMRKRARALVKLQPLVSKVRQHPSVRAYFRFSASRSLSEYLLTFRYV